MKKSLLFSRAGLMGLLLAALNIIGTGMVMAQDVVRIHRNDGVVLITDILSTDSLDFSEDDATLRLHLGTTQGEVAVADIDSITFGPAVSGISVTYTDGKPVVLHPYAFRGVDISVDANGCVTVNSQLSEELTYTLTGTGHGAFKLYSPKKQTLVLQNLNLTANDGPALNIQSKKKTTVLLPAGTTNSLTDATTYTPVGEEDMKGAFFSEGQLVFEGEGALQVVGLYKHALCSDDYIEISSGQITVASSVGDALHCKDYFEMTGGAFTATAPGSDGIDCEGHLRLLGGTVNVTLATADTKALKCDSTLTFAGGTAQIILTGDCTKGLKSGTDLLVSDGMLQFTCSGGVTVTDGDPSYCTAIKADGTLTIAGGEITIQHTGTAGKGISADGEMRFTGGKVVATMTGEGGTYTNASNTSDTYNATAVKADVNLNIEAGTLDLSCSGSGGKGISCDGILTIGTEAGGPTITAATTGSKIGGTSSGGGTWGPFGGGGGGGGGGGWPGGPGSSTSSTGGNPKAIRCEGNIYVENGTLNLSTTQDGGEGLESKQTLTINGGTILCNTYDDAMNASSAIVINGGCIYAYASGNDGIDSNGTITINGGLILSAGSTSPEEGFDCDQNTFLINGGTLVGLGGATSTPSSQSAQCSAVYSGSSASTGTTYSVTDSSGNHVLSVTMPRSYSSMTMLFSAPGLQQSGTYAIKTGCTLSGGTDFQGLVTGGTASGGSQLKSFTTSSKVTTVR